MGAFFRRILAFLLGFVMSAVAVLGGVAGGAYWAYKNLSLDLVTGEDPDDVTVSRPIDGMTVEDFVADLQSYMNDPNSYTIGELEEKYGVSLNDWLGDALNDDYKNIQLFALLAKDNEAFLESVKLSVVVDALPEGMLSEEAAQQLGKHTLLDLVNDTELSEKLNELLGTLKVGDVLGFAFERGGDMNAPYELKADLAESIGNEGVVQLASIIGNLEMAALVRGLSGEFENDLLDEIMNYGLTELGDVDLGELLAAFVPEDVDLPVDIAGVFGGKTLRDLISGELHDYSLDFATIFSGVTLGDVLGHEYRNGYVDGEGNFVADDDGEPVLLDKDGNPVTGIIRDLSDLNVGDIITGLIASSGSENITIDSVLDYILSDESLESVTVGSILETALGLKQDAEGNWTDAEGKPLEGAFAVIEPLLDLGIMDVVELFTDEEFTLGSVADLFGDITVGDFIAPLVGLEKNENGEWIDENGEPVAGVDAVLGGLMDIAIADVINGVDSIITDQNIIPIIEALLDNGLGDVELGTVLSYTQNENGEWIDENGEPAPELFDKLFDLTLGELFDNMVSYDEEGNVVIDLDVVEIVDYLLSDATAGDVLQAISPDIYEKVTNVLDSTGVESIKELLIETPIGDIVKAIDESKKEEIEEIFGDITVGDVTALVGGVLTEFGVDVEIVDLILEEIQTSALGDDSIIDIEGIKETLLEEVTISSYVDAIQNVLEGAEILPEDSVVTQIVDELHKYLYDNTISNITEYEWKEILVETIIGTVGTVIKQFVEEDAIVDDALELVESLFKDGASLGDLGLADLTVSGLIDIVDGVLDIVAPEVLENGYYLAVTELVEDLVGEATIYEGDPFKLTLNDVADTFLDNEISAVVEAVKSAASIVIEGEEYEQVVYDALDLIEKVFVDGTTVREHELKPVTIINVLKGVKETVNVAMPEGELKDSIVNALDKAIVLADAVFTDDPLPNVKLVGSEEVVTVAELVLDVVECFVETGVYGDTVIDVVEILYDDTTIAEFVETSKAITWHQAIDATAYAVDALVEVEEKILNGSSDLLKEIISNCAIAEGFKLNGNGKFVNMVDDTITILEGVLNKVFNWNSTIGRYVALAKDVFNEVTIGNCSTEALNAILDIVVAETLAEIVTIAFNDNVPQALETALGTVEGLYGDTTVREFVDATLNLNVHTVIDEVCDLLSETGIMSSVLSDGIAEVLKSVVTPESTVSKVEFAEFTVGVVVEDLRTVFETCEAEGYLGAIESYLDTVYLTFDKIVALELSTGEKFGDVYLKDVAKKGLDIYFYSALDAVAEIVISVPVEEKYVNMVVDATKAIVDETSTLGKIYIKKELTVNDVYAVIEDILEIFGVTVDGKAEEAIDLVLGIYGEVVISDFVDTAWDATKDIVITETLTDILELVNSPKTEFDFYELIPGVTVGDFIDNTDETVNGIVDVIMSNDDPFGLLNDIVADLYFNKEFEDTTALEQAAIYGTYAAAAIITYIVSPETVEELLADFRIGDIVAMFTVLVDEDGTWVYGSEPIAAILSDVLNVTLDKILNLAEGEIKFKDVIDYSYVRVADVGAAVKDVIGVLVEEGVVGSEIASMIEETGDILVDTFVDRNSKIGKVALKDLTVNDVIELADGIVDIYASEVLENGYYLAVTELVGDLIGEATIYEGNPFKLTLNDVADTFLDREITYVVTAVKDAASILIEGEDYEQTVYDALDTVDKLFVAGTTVREHELKPFTVVRVLKGAKAVAGIIMPAGETEDVVLSAFDAAIALADAVVTDDPIPNVKLVGSEEIVTVAELVLDLVDCFVDTGVYGDTAVDVIEALYGDAIIAEFVEASKQITWYNVIDAAEFAVEGVIEINEKITDGSADLLKEIIANGYVAEGFKLNGNGKFVNMIDDTVTVLEGVLNKVFNWNSAIGRATALVKDVFETVTIGNCTTEALESIYNIVIAETAAEITDIVFLGLGKEQPAYVAEIKGFVSDLYGDTTVREFVDATLDLNVHTIIDEVCEVLYETGAISKNLANGLNSVLKSVVTAESTVRKVEFAEVTVSAVVEDVRTVFETCEEEGYLGAIEKYIDTVYVALEAIEYLELNSGEYFGELYLKDVPAKFFNITFYSVVDAVAETVVSIPVKEETVNTVVDAVKTVVAPISTVGRLYFNKDLTVQQVIDIAFVVTDILVKGNEQLLADIEEAVTLAAGTFVVLESKVEFIEFNDVTVGDAIELVDGVSDLFIPAISNNGIYDAVSTYVASLIGEAVLLTADHKFTPVTVKDEFFACEIKEEVVANLYDVVAEFMDEPAFVMDALLGVADLVFEDNTTVGEHKFNEITVDGVLTLADDMLSIFVPELLENGIYVEATNYVSDMIGGAVLVTAEPKFVPANIWNEFKQKEITEEVVAGLEAVLEVSIPEQAELVYNVLATLSDTVFVDNTTVEKHEFNTFNIVTVLTGAKNVTDIVMTEGEAKDKVITVFDAVIEFADVLFTDDALPTVKLAGAEKVYTVAERALAVVECFVETGVYGDTVMEVIEVLYGDTTIGEFVEASKQITWHNAIDAVELAVENVTEINEKITDGSAALLKEIIANRYVTEAFKFNGAGSFVDMTEAVITIVEGVTEKNLNRDSWVGNIVEMVEEIFADVTIGNCKEAAPEAIMSIVIAERAADVVEILYGNQQPAGAKAIVAAIENLYGDTTVKQLKDNTLALMVHDIVDEVAAVVEVFTGDKYDDDVVGIAALIKEVMANTTVADAPKFNKNMTVGSVYDSAYAALNAIGFGFGGKLSEAIEIVYNIYKDVKISNFPAEALAATKAIVIEDTVTDIVTLIGFRPAGKERFELFDLIPGVTVGDFIDNTDETVNALVERVTGSENAIGMLNGILAD
ncbi:MAG: hypothetical protein IJV67_02350, partial [Clostridia bacterium]|nr:hypothetical protein [Clostridia bacterium]